MLWDEFSTLLSGLNGETPLGYVVRIRGEKDRKKIKQFTSEEKRIYNEWRTRHQRKSYLSEADTDSILQALANAFK